MKSDNKIEFAAIPIVAVVLGILFVLFLAYDQGLWAWLLVGAPLPSCSPRSSRARRAGGRAIRRSTPPPGSPRRAPRATMHTACS